MFVYIYANMYFGSNIYLSVFVYTYTNIYFGSKGKVCFVLYFIAKGFESHLFK